jgi:two-component system NarL family sensor kinase
VTRSDFGTESVFLASSEIHLRLRSGGKSSVGRVSASKVKGTVKHWTSARGTGVVLAEALEMERTRIARELHSGAAQTLTGIKVNLELMEALMPNMPEPMTRAMGRAQLLADQALSEIRSISQRLHRPDWQRLNLQEALELLWRTARVPEKFHSKFEMTRMESALPDAVRFTIYRAAQEGLANVLRHSGATEVRLASGERNGRVYLVLEDNGSGFDTREFLHGVKTPNCGIGLRAMREEVLALNGEFALTSGSGGTCVEITLPIAENREK